MNQRYVCFTHHGRRSTDRGKQKGDSDNSDSLIPWLSKFYACANPCCRAHVSRERDAFSFEDTDLTYATDDSHSVFGISKRQRSN